MTRWSRRLLFGALAVLVPALAGCEAGLNAPTLEYHPAAFGGYAAHNGITIDNAFVLDLDLGSRPGTAIAARIAVSDERKPRDARSRLLRRKRLIGRTDGPDRCRGLSGGGRRPQHNDESSGAKRTHEGAMLTFALDAAS